MVYVDLMNYVEERLLRKFYVIKHLILLKIWNMIDIYGLGPILLVILLKVKLCRINNYLKNDTDQSLESFKNKKYTHLLKIWGADLTDMQLISKPNKALQSLLSIIDIYNKYNWVFIGIKEKVLRLLKLFRKIFTQAKQNTGR